MLDHASWIGDGGTGYCCPVRRGAAPAPVPTHLPGLLRLEDKYPEDLRAGTFPSFFPAALDLPSRPRRSRAERKAAFKFSVFTQERTWVVRPPEKSLTQASCPRGLPEAPPAAGHTGLVHLGLEPFSGPICSLCPRLLGPQALVSHKQHLFLASQMRHSQVHKQLVTVSATEHSGSCHVPSSLSHQRPPASSQDTQSLAHLS